ncbi:hypothetical protein [Rathayibacter sp. VKM Ac-2760]|uniref:hypothetical protein n=1 Tax=Rathayibacter sp. VKM Ac-2760 TaxID=2609253 RepID=UPI0013189E87|nr:hypothetical protein [Rathayibacter sp. VKM Ac-2760]QHC58830.1 hypothetical protein GSU72_09940 [Rathayibacter sp. VKM Ac-2760]
MTDLAEGPPAAVGTGAPSGDTALEARMRIVLELAAGASEAEVAHRLELSPESVHQELRSVLGQLTPQLLAVAAHRELAGRLDVLWSAVQGRGGDERTLVVLLEEQASLLTEHRPRGSGLTEDQAGFLVDSGTMTAEQLAIAEAAVARGELADLERRTRLEAVADSLDTAEVAALLRVDETRVRHRKAKDGLYAFKAGTKLRFPAWQFTDDREQPMLPGMPALVKAIPGDMHPASMRGFMTTPQEDLLISESAVTPVRWLTEGGDPHEVLVALAGFDES